MELKFKIIRTVIFIALGIAAPFGSYIMITGEGLNIDNDEIGWRIFFASLALFTNYIIWIFLFTRLCNIKIDNNVVYLKNLVTKKELQISIDEIVEVKFSFWANTIDIINKEGKKIIRIDRETYSNIDSFLKIIDEKIKQK